MAMIVRSSVCGSKMPDRSARCGSLDGSSLMSAPAWMRGSCASSRPPDQGGGKRAVLDPTCGLGGGEHVHDEPQRADRPAAGGVVAVGHRGGDVQLDAAADLDAEQALVPALDDGADAELEVQRLRALPGRVELLAVDEGDADVVHG